MAVIFLLHHEYGRGNRDEAKLIGAYATQADAEAAIARVRDQPGFRDWPDGFTIAAYTIGADHWAEGFVEVVNILVPSRRDPPEYHVAASVWRPGDLYEISDLDQSAGAVFGIGDTVRCELQAVAGHGDSVLVAVERVGRGA
jgi:hypothetical protein